MAVKFLPGRGRGRVAGGKANVRIIGLKKITDDFDRMRSKSDSRMTRQIHLAATRIAKEANREVPVDKGRLLKSIEVEKFTRAAIVKVDAPYAGFVEKGTKYMKAQPYFFKHIPPSLKKLRAAILKLITK